MKFNIFLGSILIVCLSVYADDVAKVSDEHENVAKTTSEHEVIRPKVVYLQYDTAQEAEAVQKDILKQFDSLGGETIIAPEVISPVLDAAKIDSSVIGAIEKVANVEAQDAVKQTKEDVKEVKKSE